MNIHNFHSAGQERFRTITTAYYRGAMGIMLTYDVTDEQSFLNIRNWMKNIEEHAADNVNKMLIGNKCDLIEKRVVEVERGQQLAKSYGIPFMETSAKNNINVEEAFFTIAREIKSRLIDSGEVDPEETKAQDREPGSTEKKDPNANKTSTGGTNGTVKIDSQGTGESDKKKKKSWCSIL